MKLQNIKTSTLWWEFMSKSRKAAHKRKAKEKRNGFTILPICLQFCLFAPAKISSMSVSDYLHWHFSFPQATTFPWSWSFCGQVPWSTILKQKQQLPLGWWVHFTSGIRPVLLNYSDRKKFTIWVTGHLTLSTLCSDLSVHQMAGAPHVCICGSQSVLLSRISGEVIRNANFQVPPQIYRIRKSEGGAQASLF